MLSKENPLAPPVPYTRIVMDGDQVPMMLPVVRMSVRENKSIGLVSVIVQISVKMPPRLWGSREAVEVETVGLERKDSLATRVPLVKVGSQERPEL
jgi:hypothetical protein